MDHILPLSPQHVDCATAVMLKILDGKCKMIEEEKIIMAALYERVKDDPSLQLGQPHHDLIAQAKRAGICEEMRVKIYEQRLYAETMISRPVMKAFKAMLRAQGVLDV